MTMNANECLIRVRNSYSSLFVICVSGVFEIASS